MDLKRLYRVAKEGAVDTSHIFRSPSVSSSPALPLSLPPSLSLSSTHLRSGPTQRVSPTQKCALLKE